MDVYFSIWEKESTKSSSFSNPTSAQILQTPPKYRQTSHQIKTIPYSPRLYFFIQGHYVKVAGQIGLEEKRFAWNHYYALLR